MLLAMDDRLRPLIEDYKATVARAVAEGFLEGGPLAQAMIKTGMNQSWEMSFGEALTYEANAQAVCLGSEDASEGISAFLQRRPPTFKGR